MENPTESVVVAFFHACRAARRRPKANPRLVEVVVRAARKQEARRRMEEAAERHAYERSLEL